MKTHHSNIRIFSGNASKAIETIQCINNALFIKRLLSYRELIIIINNDVFISSICCLV